MDGCSYDHDHDCHAGASTVTDAADCLTFAPAWLPAPSGLGPAIARGASDPTARGEAPPGRRRSGPQGRTTLSWIVRDADSVRASPR